MTVDITVYFLSESRCETRSLHGTFVEESKFRFQRNRFRIHRYVAALYNRLGPFDGPFMPRFP